MNYSILTQWCMKTELQKRDAVSTAGRAPPPPPYHRLNLQSNQLPSTPLQLVSSMWGAGTETDANISLEELQSKLLQCKRWRWGDLSIHSGAQSVFQLFQRLFYREQKHNCDLQLKLEELSCDGMFEASNHNSFNPQYICTFFSWQNNSSLF